MQPHKGPQPIFPEFQRCLFQFNRNKHVCGPAVTLPSPEILMNSQLSLMRQKELDAVSYFLQYNKCQYCANGQELPLCCYSCLLPIKAEREACQKGAGSPLESILFQTSTESPSPIRVMSQSFSSPSDTRNMWDYFLYLKDNSISTQCASMSFQVQIPNTQTKCRQEKHICSSSLGRQRQDVPHHCLINNSRQYCGNKLK